MVVDAGVDQVELAEEGSQANRQRKKGAKAEVEMNVAGLGHKAKLMYKLQNKLNVRLYLQILKVGFGTSLSESLQQQVGGF